MSRARHLRRCSPSSAARRAALNEARDAAAQATVRLEQVAGEHRATVATIRARSARAAARVDELLAQARAAEQASQKLTARAAAEADTLAAEQGTPDEASCGAAGGRAGTRTLVVDAVAYHLPGRTASGLPVGVGVVAVDPNVIPLGTRMFIPGYGPGIAADVGSAIRGNIIDLWMPSTAAARRWGRRTVTITIYGWRPCEHEPSSSPSWSSFALPLAATASTSSLRTDLAASLRGQWLSPGRTAAYAIDLHTGRVLFAHNASSPFVPASNAKLPVAYAALARLGASFRFTTEALGVGDRAGRFWRGDLVLRGHGDPTLTAADLNALAATVRARGITRITGWIRADESAFDTRRGGPGWKRGWVGIESPPLSALAVDRGLGLALEVASAARRQGLPGGAARSRRLRGQRCPARPYARGGA